MLHLFSDCLQLSSKALGLRLPLDHELVLPGFGAVVREAQEVEGLRASLPSGGSCVGGEPPELDQPGLALRLGVEPDRRSRARQLDVLTASCFAYFLYQGIRR